MKLIMCYINSYSFSLCIYSSFFMLLYISESVETSKTVTEDILNNLEKLKDDLWGKVHKFLMNQKTDAIKSELGSPLTTSNIIPLLSFSTHEMLLNMYSSEKKIVGVMDAVHYLDSLFLKVAPIDALEFFMDLKPSDCSLQVKCFQDVKQYVQDKGLEGRFIPGIYSAIFLPSCIYVIHACILLSETCFLYKFSTKRIMRHTFRSYLFPTL